MNTKTLRMGFMSLILAGLTACSSGDVNFSPEGPTTPRLPGFSSEPITAHGVIAASGSVNVNDVQYGAVSAAVTINGQPGMLSDLRRGQIVTVKGTINSNGTTGTAQSVSFDANLIGPVENLDAADGRLIVMGQTVTTDADTVFAAGIDPATFTGLSVGMTVQISGFADAADTIRATRIDLDVANAEQQVTGHVASLDLANLLFTINRLTVDYSGAIVIDLPGGAPTSGMSVKAIGEMSNGLFVVERLSATPAIAGTIGQRVQIAGVVTRLDSPIDFDINGSAAVTNAGTAFSNGDSDALALNAELVVDGDVASNGTITANRISFGRLVNETVTLAFEFSDFTEILVSTVFNVTVTQDSEFSVEVVVDEDVAGLINLTKSGSRLDLALTPGDFDIHTLEARITMPVLERIDLTGVVNASLHGFNQDRLTVDVGGVSRLHGDTLMIGDLIANVSGVSQLSFGNTRPIQNASVNISGVSQATVNMDVGSILAGSVSTGQGTGISTLFYYGTDVSVDVTNDFISSIVRLGETKP